MTEPKKVEPPMSKFETVTNNAIPYVRAEAAWDRLKGRHALQAQVAADFEAFHDAATEMKFLHRTTVELAQRELQDLINSCRKYAENLGWEAIY